MRASGSLSFSNTSARNINSVSRLFLGYHWCEAWGGGERGKTSLALFVRYCSSSKQLTLKQNTFFLVCSLKLDIHDCFNRSNCLLQTPEQGADNSIYVALSPELEGVGGRYFVNCQSTQSSDESYREDVQKRLWKISCELTGISE